jgi:hypothetical protein
LENTSRLLNNGSLCLADRLWKRMMRPSETSLSLNFEPWSQHSPFSVRQLRLSAALQREANPNSSGVGGALSRLAICILISCRLALAIFSAPRFLFRSRHVVLRSRTNQKKHASAQFAARLRAPRSISWSHCAMSVRAGTQEQARLSSARNLSMARLAESRHAMSMEDVRAN